MIPPRCVSRYLICAACTASRERCSLLAKASTAPSPAARPALPPPSPISARFPIAPRSTSNIRPPPPCRRSDERRVGKSVSVRVDLGGRRLLTKQYHRRTLHKKTP